MLRPVKHGAQHYRPRVASRIRVTRSGSSTIADVRASESAERTSVAISQVGGKRTRVSQGEREAPGGSRLGPSWVHGAMSKAVLRGISECAETVQRTYSSRRKPTLSPT